MHFGTPQLLGLLVALPMCAAALLWLARWRRSAARRLTGVAAGAWRWRRPLKAGLALGALALLALAAARPQIGSTRILLPREGTDVMIVLDVSASMLADDVPPNRLERAKVVLSALLDRLQGDRVGMVVFAGSAGLRLPLTTDIAAAREQIRTTTIKEGGLAAGTGIGDGIRQATQFFPTENEARSKVMIVVSDGEDLTGAPQEAVTVARGRNVVLYTMGIGTEAGGTLIAPGRDGRAQPRVDPQTGQPATSKADFGLLRALASAGKGRYVDGTADDASARLAEEIGRLARSRFESQEGTLPIERFQWPAAAALLLLVLDFLISDRALIARRRRAAIPSQLAAPRSSEEGAA